MPMTDVAFHGLLGDLVKAIEPQTEADRQAILAHLLVMFGNCCGRAPHFRVGATRHHLNLFAAVVGASSKSRKGMSRDESGGLFTAADPNWLRHCTTSGLSSGEGLVWAIRDPIERQQPIRERGGRVAEYQTVIEDPGVADKRLLVIQTEFSSVLKVMRRDGNTLSEIIRDAWDGRDLRVITKHSPAKATAPHVSIVGHITRADLHQHLDATEAANGFANRFLWLCVRRSKELPDGGDPIDLGLFVARMNQVLDHARRVGEVIRDGAARALWHRIYGRLSAERQGLLGAMTARAEAQVMRVACLYALSDGSAVVGLPHLRAALEFWRYCFDSARYLFGHSLGDPAADELLRALNQSPVGLTRREILHDVFAKNRKAGDVDRALTVLLTAGLVRSETDTDTGGRPAERWFAVADAVPDSDLDIAQGYDLDDQNDQSPLLPDPLVVKVVKVVGGTTDINGESADEREVFDL
jgi:hypothetical protein